MFNEIYEAAEATYALPKGVLAAQAIQESNGNPWAARYEPHFFDVYIGTRPRTSIPGFWPGAGQGVSETTERRLRACSFGLLQVMGQVAREDGFQEVFLTRLCDPVLGVNYGAKHLAAQLKRYDGDLSKALSAYNAGSFVTVNLENYVNPILKRMGSVV